MAVTKTSHGRALCNASSRSLFHLHRSSSNLVEVFEIAMPRHVQNFKRNGRYWKAGQGQLSLRGGYCDTVEDSTLEVPPKAELVRVGPEPWGNPVSGQQPPRFGSRSASPASRASPRITAHRRPRYESLPHPRSPSPVLPTHLPTPQTISRRSRHRSASFSLAGRGFRGRRIHF